MGRPRQTRDVDLTLLTGLGGEEAFLADARPLLDLKEDSTAERGLLELFEKHRA